MADVIQLSADGEVILASVPGGYAEPYSSFVRFLRQHLPGARVDWVAAREAFRFGHGRPFPIARRGNSESHLDEHAKIRFSSDGLQAFFILYPPKPRGRRLTEEEVARLVRAYGIPAGLLDVQALKMAILRRTYQEAEPIAKGSAPVDGEPARVTWVRGLPTDSEGFLARLGESGDAYPESVVGEVAEGEAAGLLTPPGVGTPGVAAWGAPLPAAPGPNPIRLGGGLRLAEDGRTVRALRSGHLRLVGPSSDQAAVLPLLRVRESQDLEPWARGVFPGSLVVEGDLEIRFPLKVLGDVEVRGGLVRSSLEVMGSLFVRDGVIHRGHEPVRVGGLLSAAFLDRAWVVAGTVHVRRYSLQSRLLALDTVVARAAGANLCGGQIASRQRIDAASLGSPNAMETEVSVGNPSFNAPFVTAWQAWAEALRAAPADGPEAATALRTEAERWEKAAASLPPPDLAAVRVATQRAHAGVAVRIGSATREVGNAVGPVAFAYEKIGDRDRVAMSRGAG